MGYTGKTNLQASGAAAIVPDDDNDLPITANGVWVGTGGDLHVLMNDGSEATFKKVADGTALPFHIKRVFEDSTAADMVALY